MEQWGDDLIQTDGNHLLGPHHRRGISGTVVSLYLDVVVMTAAATGAARVGLRDGSKSS
jgi:hypothetical protein